MPQLTIRRMMIATAVAAAMMATVRAAGFAVLIPVLLLAPAWMIRSVLRSYPHWARRVFLVLAMVVNGAVGLATAYWPGGLGLAIPVAILLTTFPWLAGAAAAWAQIGEGDAAQASARRLVVAVITVCLPWSMIFLGWPLVIAVTVSRPALNRLADDVVAGKSIVWPVWAGVYHIQGGRHVNGTVLLILNPDSSGNAGLVRKAAGPPGYPLINLNCDVHAGGSWYYQEED